MPTVLTCFDGTVQYITKIHVNIINNIHKLHTYFTWNGKDSSLPKHPFLPAAVLFLADTDLTPYQPPHMLPALHLSVFPRPCCSVTNGTSASAIWSAADATTFSS